MQGNGDRVVRAAQLASLALGGMDVVYAYLLARQGALATRVMGASDGAWTEWGVGLLASATALHASAALAPSRRSMAAVAVVRGAVAPGHLSLFALDPPKRRRSVALFAMNAGSASLSWWASRRVAP